MVVHLNKETGDSCGCDGRVMQTHLIKVNLLKTELRYEQLGGEDYIVVPVVMLRHGIVMNETLVPPEEVFPISWNGVPVTVQHPQNDKGEYISANAPQVIEDWSVGAIYNSRLEDNALKAEAWINVARANELDPTLIPLITSNTDMDVSTGFFSNDIASTGASKGRTYKVIARNLNPDHLALLPGGTGACSWEDGCGIRANERKDPMSTETEEKLSVSTLSKLLAAMGFKANAEDLKPNRRGDAGDYRQVVADLISNDASPFVPADSDSLSMMSYETLLAMRDQFIPSDPPEKDVKSNANKEADVADDKDKGYVTATQVAEIVANALKEALPEALKANTAAPSLSDDDKAALAAAKDIVTNARNERVAHIKANTDMTDDMLKTFSDAQLADLAKSIKAPVADYSGRGLNVEEAADGATDDAIEAMDSSVHVNAALKQLATNGKAN